MARMRPTAAAINADAPPSGISPILVNAKHEKRLLRSQYDVGRQRQRGTDTGARPLHDGHHRLWQVHDRPHGVVGGVEHRFGSVDRLLCLVFVADARARGEAATCAAESHDLDPRVGGRLFQRRR